MFSDPFSAVMALILLAFVGTLAIFFRLWKEMDAIRQTLEEMKKNMQYYAVDVSQQTSDIASLIKESHVQGEHGAVQKQAPENIGELLDKGLTNLSQGLPDLALPPKGKKAPHTEAAPRAALENIDEDEFFRRLER